MTEHKISIILQKDPLGEGIGGINTFLKGFVKYAPRDFFVEIIGITTNKTNRPVGKWQIIDYSGRNISFFPVLYTADQNKKSKIPLSFKFVLSLFRYKKRINLKEDKLLEFHRIEPVYTFRKLGNLKVIFIHSNIKEIYNIYQESRWSRIKKLYFRLEKNLIPLADKIFVVSNIGVDFYKEVFPSIKNRFIFIPTWVDDTIFFPLSDKAKSKDILREMFAGFTFNDEDEVLLFAGRLVSPKNPLLLIDTFNQLFKMKKNIKLLIIGNGSLREEIIKRIKFYNMEDKIKILDTLPQNKLALIMRACDIFVLTSAYEGMPRVVIESLASGTPVVSTDVGEVNLVVRNNYSGVLVRKHTPLMIANAITTILDNKKRFGIENCLNSVKDYNIELVLNKIYKAYRNLVINRKKSSF